MYDEVPQGRVILDQYFPRAHLISQEVWDASRSKMHQEYEFDKRKHLLQYLCRCPKCGGPLSISSKGTGSAHRANCNGYDRPSCGVGASFDVAALEGIVFARLRELLDHNYTKAEFLAELNRELAAKRQPYEHLLAVKDKEIADAELAYENARKRFFDLSQSPGLVSPQVERDCLSDMNNRRAEIDQLISIRAETISVPSELILVDVDDAALLLAELDNMAANLPWRPTTTAELETYVQIRKLIDKIILRPRDPEDLSICDVELHLNLSTGADEHKVKRVYVTPGVLVGRAAWAVVDQQQVKADAAARASGEMLTDIEFAGLPFEASREAVDAVLISAKTGLSCSAVLRARGGNGGGTFSECGQIRKVYRGQLETYLKKTRGQEFTLAIVDYSRPGKDTCERSRLLAARHPILLLKATKPNSGVTRLSSEQIAVVRAMFPKARGTRAKPMEERVDAYLTFVRLGINYYLAKAHGLIRKDLRVTIDMFRTKLGMELTRRLLKTEGIELVPRFQIAEFPAYLRRPIDFSENDLIAEIKAIAVKGAARKAPGECAIWIGPYGIDFNSGTIHAKDGRSKAAGLKILELLKWTLDRAGSDILISDFRQHAESIANHSVEAIGDFNRVLELLVKFAEPGAARPYKTIKANRLRTGISLYKTW